VPPAPKPVDLATVISLGILAYILSNITHEALGHGGACLITGGHPLLLTTVNMECSVDNRFVIAGGSLMNALAAVFFLLLLRATSRNSPRLKYFAWLSMILNLLSPAGYLAFSGIGGFGDWAQFIQGFPAQWVWRIALTIIGSALYILFVHRSLLELRPLIGTDPRQRITQAIRLTRAPYFAGGTLACIAGAFNPQGWILIALSAAASTFGGSSALLWSPNWLRGKSIPAGPDPEPLPIEKSWPLILTAAIAAAVFISVLGPGIRVA
jgi:hypothetical protein